MFKKTVYTIILDEEFMLASIAFLLGILIAVTILKITHNQEILVTGLPRKPTPLSWIILGLGMTAVFSLSTGFLINVQSIFFNLYLLSITSASAAVIAGATSLIERNRPWPTWIGFGLASFPFLFWILFAAGHLFAPGE